jgi:hypothetical protein
MGDQVMERADMEETRTNQQQFPGGQLWHDLAPSIGNGLFSIEAVERGRRYHRKEIWQLVLQENPNLLIAERFWAKMSHFKQLKRCNKKIHEHRHVIILGSSQR